MVHKLHCTPWWVIFQFNPRGASCFFSVPHGHHGPSRRGGYLLTSSSSLGSLHAHIGDAGQGTGAFQHGGAAQAISHRPPTSDVALDEPPNC